MFWFVSLEASVWVGLVGLMSDRKASLRHGGVTDTSRRMQRGVVLVPEEK